MSLFYVFLSCKITHPTLPSSRPLLVVGPRVHTSDPPEGPDRLPRGTWVTPYPHPTLDVGTGT